MWTGSVGFNRPARWRYTQFDKTSLKVTLGLLESLNEGGRKSPILVARKMTDEVDGLNPPGVVFGRWPEDGTYPGGKKPWEWEGSDEILKQYDMSGAPVKYGQCWVYGGVLTTVLRCLGIPARPITNFNSAHDRPVFDRYLDEYWDRLPGGGLVPSPLSERWWNYHVWCDAWMKRPDRPGHDGWQAVDATPQEPSGGVYRLGPAPHTAIRADIGGDYDVTFVVSEVDADFRIFVQPIGGGAHVLLEGPPDIVFVGQNISTKTVGIDDREIITSSYKATQGGTAGGQILLPESGIEVDITAPSDVALGSDIVWTVSLVNPTAVSRSAVVVITGWSIIYNGTFLSELGETDLPVNLDANGGSQAVSLTIPASVYTVWTGVTDTFYAGLSVVVPGTTDVMVDRRTTIVEPPIPDLTLTPNTPIPVGGMVEAELRCTNPLTSSLSNVLVVYHVGEELSVEGAPEVLIGTVMPGEEIVATRSIRGEWVGQHLLIVTLHADQLTVAEVDGTIEVFADCNNNGVDDVLDSGTTSADCNVNSVPDECEPDCDNNNVPDECDLIANPLRDCNANQVPDGCDIVSGVLEDCDQNLIPDECESFLDCNSNGIPDVCDIARGVVGDCDQNLIPDECEPFVDCNANAIRDSCDVANGQDCNANGIPDECDLVNFPNGDCNHNAILDTCETQSCSGDPACADCNSNAVPDTCDLETMVPNLLGQLTNPSVWGGADFGRSVAAGPDVVLIGAPYDYEPDVLYSGSVYVFRREGEAFQQEARLLASDGWSYGGEFGYSVSLHGDLAVIGDPTHLPLNNGAAYIFRREGMTWIEEQELAASDGADDQFGSVVAIHNDLVFVSAPYDDHSGKADAGSVYVFRREGTQWIQEAKLTSDAPSAHAYFGDALALDGSRGLVGEFARREAYVFRRAGMSWTLETKLPSPGVGFGFGFSVALADPIAVVSGSATAETPFTVGAVYVFRREGSTWTLVQTLIGSDAAPESRFGASLAIAGRVLTVGAPATVNLTPSKGAVYLFAKPVAGSWIEAGKLTSPDTAANGEFGTSISVATDVMFAGISLVGWDRPVYAIRVLDPDCNGSSVPDDCEGVLQTNNDCNRNRISDECELPLPGEIVWSSELLSTDRTTRSLRFRVLPPCMAIGSLERSAIKVSMINLQDPNPPNLVTDPPPNFSGYEAATCAPKKCAGGARNGLTCVAPADCPSPGVCTAVAESNGCARWVGKPGTFLEAQDTPSLGNYRAARLQCTPFYWDWVTETGSGLITVVGAEILPSSEYSVQVYGASCMGAEGNCINLSAPVTMYTRRFGDVETSFCPPTCGAETGGQPNVTDVAQLVNKYKSVSDAPVKSISQLQPNLAELNADINALDIVAVVDAVKQKAYAFSGPCPCPSAVTCAVTACKNATICVSTYGAGSTCVKTCRGGVNDGDPCVNNSHCPGYPAVCSTGRIGAPCTNNAECNVQGDCAWEPGAPIGQCTNVARECERFSECVVQGTCPTGGICDKECVGGANAGLPCNSVANCPGTGAYCAVVTNTGFCRDRCRRCTP